MNCRHLVLSEEAYRIDDDGKETPIDVHLCAWADTAPDALLNVPRWIQRNALSGHLWQEPDCKGCPCYDPITAATSNGEREVNDHAKLLRFLQMTRNRTRDYPMSVWGDQVRFSLSNDLIKLGFGGVLELTPAGRAALTEETGGGE